MSKLNWYWAYYPHLDAPEQQKESALHAGYIKVVSKDDVDKVIADLEESHKKEVEQLLIEFVELEKQVRDYAQGLYVIQARAEKEARHHKYKRCLAMAKYCEAMRGHYLSYEEPKWFWYRKWSERWLELAEKFKPNKEADK